MLMRGSTPPTTYSPPILSRLTGNPPNRQPATVCEGELVGRGPTSRWTSMRVAPNCRPPQTEWHELKHLTSTSHPPQQQDTVYRELSPCTGKGASSGPGQLFCATLPAAGCSRAEPLPPSTILCARRVVRRRGSRQRGGEEKWEPNPKP